MDEVSAASLLEVLNRNVEPLFVGILGTFIAALLVYLFRLTRGATIRYIGSQLSQIRRERMKNGIYIYKAVKHDYFLEMLKQKLGTIRIAYPANSG
jgi:fructose-1,6-bisphosphatase